jgi:hypothetical protein
MRRAAARHSVTAALAVCVAAGPGAAADWSVSGAFSERVQVDPAGGDAASLDSTTSLSLVIQAETPTTSLLLAPGVSATLSTERNNDFETFNAVNPRLNSQFSHRSLRWTLGGFASVVPRQTNAIGFDEVDADSDIVDLPDDEISRENTIQITANAGVTVGYALDPRNSLSAGLTARAREFADEGENLTPTRSVGTNFSWSRTLDSRTSGSLGFGYNRFMSDGGIDSDSFSFTLGGGREVTPRLSLNGSAGFSLTQSDDGGSPDIGFTGGFGANWALRDDTTFSFGASQFVDQDAFGEVSNRTSVRASLGHDINSVSGVSLAARFSSVNPLLDFGGSDESSSDDGSASISTSYRLGLTEDWSMQVGYSVRVDLSDDDLSNRVFFQISRGLDLLP